MTMSPLVDMMESDVERPRGVLRTKSGGSHSRNWQKDGGSSEPFTVSMRSGGSSDGSENSSSEFDDPTADNSGRSFSPPPPATPTNGRPAVRRVKSSSRVMVSAEELKSGQRPIRYVVRRQKSSQSSADGEDAESNDHGETPRRQIRRTLSRKVVRSESVSDDDPVATTPVGERTPRRQVRRALSSDGLEAISGIVATPGRQLCRAFSRKLVRALSDDEGGDNVATTTTSATPIRQMRRTLSRKVVRPFSEGDETTTTTPGSPFTRKPVRRSRSGTSKRRGGSGSAAADSSDDDDESRDGGGGRQTTQTPPRRRSRSRPKMKRAQSAMGAIFRRTMSPEEFEAAKQELVSNKIAEQEKTVQEMDTLIARTNEFVVARLHSENPIGALVSYKQLRKYVAHQEQAKSAISKLQDFLSTTPEEVEDAQDMELLVEEIVCSAKQENHHPPMSPGGKASTDNTQLLEEAKKYIASLQLTEETVPRAA